MPQEPELRAARDRLDEDGFLVVPSFFDPDECERLSTAAGKFGNGRAGSRRLLGDALITDAASRIRALPEFSKLLPDSVVAVQCTLFAKTTGSNWSVTPHQDLSIPVEGYVDSPACRGWSRKDSELFVQPPESVLNALLAVRLQLDDHAAHTGPLEVVPQSHRLGRLKSANVAEFASDRRIACIPQQGGAVVLRPLTIHASSKSKSSLPRRVLHFLFGPRDLPLGLRWAAVA